MKPEEFRAVVLQAAIQGKLVPQDPNDESASVLLERIREEKQKMIKEGKIKKDRNDSFIFKRDNHYYENIDGEEICIDSEIEFDLPDNWAWSRLGNICTYIHRGKSPKYSEIEKYPVIAQKCNQWSGVDMSRCLFIDPESIVRYTSDCIVKTDDILINSTGTGSLGRVGLYDEKLNKYDVAVADSHVTVVRCNGVNSRYVYYYLISPAIQSVIEDWSTGSTNQKELPTKVIQSILVPIPPIDQQLAIVKTLKSAMILSNKHDDLHKYVKSMCYELRNSIMCNAIQGKLTSRNPNDKPVIIDCKNPIIRRDNSYYELLGGEEVCIDSEIEYDIPDNWAWCRLKNIVDINPRNNLDDDMPVSFIPMERVDGGFCSSVNPMSRRWGDVKKGYTHFREGDVVLAKILPCFQNLKSFIASNLINGFGSGTTEFFVLRIHEAVIADYLLWLVKNPMFIAKGLSTIQGTVGQQRVGKSFIEEYLVPLPPIEEQKRICIKIEDLLSITNQLSD